MRTVSEHEYTTYPRRFATYKWYKPLLVGAMFIVFLLICITAVDLISKAAFGSIVTDTGYDDMDFFTAAGAFSNGAKAAVVIPCLILAALIVKDRPVSSYWSSMGGWRWKVFLKTIAVSFVILGIPTIAKLLAEGRTDAMKFTLGGIIILTLLVPLQGIGEEMLFRGYLTQTVSSWFMLPAAGIIFQILLFSLVHPYNIIGVVEIAVSALIYALVTVCSKGIEAASALHIINNISEIYMAGFGFGKITAEQTVPSIAFNLGLKVLFFLFILYAGKKLHWFDELQKDDVTEYNAKHQKHPA